MAGIELRAGRLVTLPPTVEKGQLVVGVSGDLPAVPMNQTMVESAKGDQVVEVGGTTIGPVPNVMNLSPLGPAATCEATTLVSALHQAAEPVGNLSGGPTHSHSDPTLPVEGWLDPRVAR